MGHLLSDRAGRAGPVRACVYFVCARVLRGGEGGATSRPAARRSVATWVSRLSVSAVVGPANWRTRVAAPSESPPQRLISRALQLPSMHPHSQLEMHEPAVVISQQESPDDGVPKP